MAFIDALLSLFFVSFLGILLLGPFGFPAFLKLCRLRGLSRGWALLAALPGPGTLLFLHVLSHGIPRRGSASGIETARPPSRPGEA